MTLMVGYAKLRCLIEHIIPKLEISTLGRPEKTNISHGKSSMM
jgi:hypothetical protein